MVLKIDVRGAVLDAADELLLRSGFRRMTMDDIARAAGIGKGTIYLHFASKGEVALSTIDRIVDRVVARLEEIASGAGTAADKLRAMLVARVLIRIDGARNHRESLDDLLAAIRPALLERRRGWFRREAKVFAKVLAAGLAGGELALDDPAATARDLLAATGSFLPYSLTARELGRRNDIETRVGRVADLLVHGLSS